MASPLVPSFEEACFGSVVPFELSGAFAANDFFNGVEGSLVRECATMFRIAWLPAGALLHARKRLSTSLFLILEGSVRLEYFSVGKAVGGAALRGGTFTGESSLFGHEPLHRVTARCHDLTLLGWVRAVDLTAVLHREPQIALNVAHSLQARVLGTLTALDELLDHIDES